MKNTKPKTYAFDFDGVLSQYDGVFISDEHVGKPMPEVVKAIKILKEQGHKILVYSTRSSKTLEDYCKKHNIPADYFNNNPEYKTGNPGKPVASIYVDDRGLHYHGQTAEELVREINNFQVHWKK